MLHHHYCEPDEECIRLFVHGDPRGFTELVNEHRHQLFGYVNGYVRDRQDTEDIIQNVVIDLYTFLLSGKYHEEGKFLHLLKRMAHERTIDFLRRRSRNRKLFIPLDNVKFFEKAADETTPFDSAQGDIERGHAERSRSIATENEPDEQPEVSDAGEEVRNAFKDAKQLGPGYRKVFDLHVRRHLPFDEIGKRLGIKPHTASSYYARAVKILRKRRQQRRGHT